MAIEEGIFFTVINPETEEETRMNIEPYSHGYDVNGVYFDFQQIGELGGLFIALSKGMDADSIPELLEGYGLPLPDFYKKLKGILATKKDFID